MSSKYFTPDIEERLKSLYTGKNRRTIKNNNSDDLLLQCMNIVVEEHGLAFKEVTLPDTLSIKEKIIAIAQNSNVYVRKILLSGKWWGTDFGSAIAFSKEGYIRVLLRKNRDYKLFIPETNTYTNINNEVNEQLHKTAYIFYPLFSENEKINSKSLFSFSIKGRQKDLLLFVILSIIISLVSISFPLAFSSLIGTVIPSAEKNLLLQIGIGLFLIGLLTFLFTIFRNKVLLRLESKIDLKMQAAFFNRMIMLPVNFYSQYNNGDLLERGIAISKLRNMISGPLITIMFSLVLLFSNALLMYVFSPYLAIYGTLSTIIYLFIALLILRADVIANRKYIPYKTGLTTLVFQFINGVNKIKSAGKSLHIIKKWSETYSEERGQHIMTQNIANNLLLINHIFPAISIFVVYKVAESQLDHITPAQFTGFITAFGVLIVQVGIITTAITTLLKSITQYKLTEPILQSIAEGEPQINEMFSTVGNIEFSKVSFRYSQDGPLILNNLTFKIKSGQFTAFVGESGSGKSTVFRLLLGFKEPLSGSIYYDNKDFKQLNKKIIRRQMGVVLQNSTLMTGSIYENLVGYSKVDHSIIWEALKKVGMYDEIASLPMGLHTIIADGGGGFSGGQRQRLLVARALIGDPKILLFDEATSALDNISQKIITETLQHIKSTKIVIAHRLETIMGADYIYFLGNGNILQQGKPQELLIIDGPFRQFAEKQMNN